MKANEKKLKAGFTLVEVLITVAIVGVIAAAISVGVATIRRKARDAKRSHDIQSIYAAAMAYFVERGEYPLTGPSTYLSLLINIAGVYELTARSDFTAPVPASGILPWSDLENKLSSYIYPLPKDPINNLNIYYYSVFLDDGGKPLIINLQDGGYGHACAFGIGPLSTGTNFRALIYGKFESITPRETCLAFGDPKVKIILLP